MQLAIGESIRHILVSVRITDIILLAVLRLDLGATVCRLTIVGVAF